MENNNNNNNISIFDSVISISYLIWIIAKQHWKLLIVLFLSAILLLPMPKLFFTMNYDFKNSAGIIASFAILPSILILLVFLPIVYTQVSSSSIRKRIKSTGISERIFTLVLTLSFALLALLMFYIMILISIIIFDGKKIYVDGLYSIMWNSEIVWWSLILMTPISMIGLSTLGILLSRWNAPEIGKGVATFLIVILLLTLSRTIISPLDALSSSRIDPNSENYDLNRIQRLKTFDTLLFVLNPFGAMTYSAEYGMIGGIITTIPPTQHSMYWDSSISTDGINYLVSYERYTSVTPTILYSCLWTTLLTAGTVYWT